MASKSNEIFFFGNVNSSSYENFLRENTSVKFVDLQQYSIEANNFSTIYKHYSEDHSPERLNYELKCFQRWFILKEYMTAHNIEGMFYSDSDSVIVRNVTQVCAIERGQCSVIVNIENQAHNFHWVGAGESSYWTLLAVQEFCNFMTATYKYHHNSLMLKSKSGSTVTDMSLIWLWWVVRHKNQSNGIGIPSGGMNHKAFQFAASLSLPAAEEFGNSINMCNGMDVINGSVFDHRVS